MRIYLDDDSAWPLLAQMLTKAGHDVQMPHAAGMAGKPDPLHLAHAIQSDRACLTKNYDDYLALQHVIQAAAGHHPDADASAFEYLPQSKRAEAHDGNNRLPTRIRAALLADDSVAILAQRSSPLPNLTRPGVKRRFRENALDSGIVTPSFTSSAGLIPEASLGAVRAP